MKYKIITIMLLVVFLIGANTIDIFQTNKVEAFNLKDWLTGGDIMNDEEFEKFLNNNDPGSNSESPKNNMGNKTKKELQKIRDRIKEEKDRFANRRFGIYAHSAKVRGKAEYVSRNISNLIAKKDKEGKTEEEINAEQSKWSWSDWVSEIQNRKWESLSDSEQKRAQQAAKKEGKEEDLKNLIKKQKEDKKNETFDTTMYNNPLFNQKAQTAEPHTPDDIISIGDKLISDGQKSNLPTVSQKAVQVTGETIYSILLALSVVVAVIVGGVLGIKFMMAGVEEKAEVKKALWPYFIGCMVVFGSFGIWRLVITLLRNM